jgi:hypothetical protein
VPAAGHMHGQPYLGGLQILSVSPSILNCSSVVAPHAEQTRDVATPQISTLQHALQAALPACAALHAVEGV